MSKPLIINPRVEKAIRRLRNMGLNVSVWSESPSEVYILIPLNDICKLIERQINYPNKEVLVEENYLVVRIWRSSIIKGK